ncbi:MAG: GIY-YIG nuclease family protein [Acidobacteriia bacterium]|nr:GIY-YIG nuclease family protein [Terriglobia bacterium]
MEITIIWHKPIRLRSGVKDNLIYACDELDRIPEKPGIYVFARKFGQSQIPLYVGQAANLRKRIDQQLNNAKLMMAMKNAAKGRRLLLIAELSLQPGQQEKKVLDIVERTCIKSALSYGYELLNKQGIKSLVHTVSSKGKKKSHNPFLRKMNIAR